MAQILDKQGLQHYANKMCNADNRKVGSKNLPTALNEIDIAIDGFKTLFETEYGTPVNMELENNENAFSVGTGTNVDKRSEVENSFTDVQLSGNSLVNLADEWKDVTNETISFYYGAERSICKTSKLKNNTYYTLIVNYKINLNNTTAYDTMELGLSNSKNSVTAHPSKGETNYAFKVKDGLNVIKFHLSDYKHDEYTYFNIRPIRRGTAPVEGESVTFSCSDLILLEGDWTNKPLPQYFEGMKSVGQDDVNGHKIEILSRNKNLLNLSNVTRNAWGVTVAYNQGVLNINGTLSNEKDNGLCDYYLCGSWTGEDDNLKLKPNTKYTFSGNVPNYVEIYIIHNTKVLCQLTGVYNNNSFTNSSHGRINAIMVRVKAGFTFSNTTINIQIEEGSTSTSFIAPNLNKKEISLNEPLRGLPNGVRDTIEQINGEWKLIRRTGEKILRKTDSIQVDFNSPYYDESYPCLFFSMGITVYNFGDKLPKATAGNSAMMCSLLPQQSFSWGSEAEGFRIGSNVDFNIRKTKLNSIDSNGVKEYVEKMYLEGTPFKIIYELATPIIEDISPVTLQCWKNGTISIDEILPVETTHTVALNKSAQIQKNIEELTLLRNRVEALEKQYNNSTLNQAYELELLRLDMELDNIV